MTYLVLWVYTIFGITREVSGPMSADICKTLSWIITNTTVYPSVVAVCELGPPAVA